MRFNSYRRRKAARDSIPSNTDTKTNHGDIHGTSISAGPAATVPDAPPAPAAGSKAAELRAWELAMVELARRHSMPQVWDDGGVAFFAAATYISIDCCDLLLFLPAGVVFGGEDVAGSELCMYVCSFGCVACFFLGLFAPPFRPAREAAQMVYMYVNVLYVRQGQPVLWIDMRQPVRAVKPASHTRPQGKGKCAVLFVRRPACCMQSVFSTHTHTNDYDRSPCVCVCWSPCSGPLPRLHAAATAVGDP